MREEFNLLIKFFATRTVPAAETKSMGLKADALVPCFLLAILTTYLDTKLSSTYRDLVPFRSFIMTRHLSAVYLDWQKTRHRDADGT